MMYRQATRDDSATIASLHARSWQLHYRGILTDAYLDDQALDDRRRLWENRLAHPPENQYVWVAENGGVLCGFACAYAGHDPVWGSLLDNLHVVPGCQGQGLGTRLLTATASWVFGRAPAVPLYLLVYRQNEGARRFYESLGGTCEETFLTDNPGGGQAEVCRYVWRDPGILT